MSAGYSAHTSDKAGRNKFLDFPAFFWTLGRHSYKDLVQVSGEKVGEFKKPAESIAQL